MSEDDSARRREEELRRATRRREAAQRAVQTRRLNSRSWAIYERISGKTFHISWCLWNYEGEIIDAGHHQSIKDPTVLRHLAEDEIKSAAQIDRLDQIKRQTDVLRLMRGSDAWKLASMYRAAAAAETARAQRRVQHEADRSRRAESARRARESEADVMIDPLAKALVALGLKPGKGYDANTIRQAYHAKATTAHPDRGGSAAAFIALTQARDLAMRSARGVN